MKPEMAESFESLRSTTVVIALIAAALAASLVLELRYIRSRRGKLQERRVAQADLPDNAHNALATTKAIAETLARGGASSAEANSLIREAQMAYSQRNYRVTLELTERARGLLKSEKARYEKEGNAAKLYQLRGASEPTTKETLTRDVPSNYLQAKFLMSLAESGIASLRSRGTEVSEVSRVMDESRQAFDDRDFETALKLARQAQRVLDAIDSASSEKRGAVETETRKVCASCAHELKPGDQFCRRCGGRVVNESKG